MKVLNTSYFFKLCTVACLFVFMSAWTSAQITITGTVNDTQGETMPGVNVRLQGTAIGSITDANGRYSISVPNEAAVLQFSFMGYLTQDILVGNQRNINPVMQENVSQIDEVVVVGYGAMRRSDLTGAVGVATAQELTTKPVLNVLEALQGKVAGVDITSNQRPGELGTVRVRGTRSLTATNDPLYVVDGMVLSSGGIESINPRDIESITVLKDASSTAIYGSRGANGVIIVTTKKGREGSFSLNYAGTLTFENIRDLQPSMSADEYITWRRWAFHNENPALYAPGNLPTSANDAYVFGSDPQTWDNVKQGWSGNIWDASKVTDTDWADFVTQTGITQTHTISAGGGNNRTKSYFSVGYLNNEGTQKGQSFERYNVSTSTDISATKWFAMGGSVNFAWSNQSYGYSRTGQSTTSGPDQIFNAARAIPNIAPPYDDAGNIVQSPGGINGVYTVIDEWKKSYDERQTLRALGSFYANVKFGEIWQPLSGLNYRVSFGPDFRFRREGIYIDKTSAVRGGGSSLARWDHNRRFSWVLNNVISYNKAMGIHRFDLTLLHEASKYDQETARISGENIPKPSYRWNYMGSLNPTNATDRVSISTDLEQRQLVSYGGRFNYTLMDKYLLTFTGRYDGSSVLAEGNKWAFFPSAAVAWRLEQEPFMQNLDLLDALKLRASVGVTGNAAVDPYATLGSIRSFYMPFGGMPDALFYVPNEPYYSANNERMANKDLSWEKTTQYNFGVDFSILRGRIGGAVDIYSTRTNDLIMDMRISTITAYDRTYANVGKTKGKGVDVTLSFVPVNNSGFVWNSTLIASWNKTEIVELAYGKFDMVDNSWFIGQPISVYFGYKADGLWQESDAAEMQKWNDKDEKFSPGMVKPVEKGEPDYVMGPDDRVILGNQNPKWTMGWSNTFSYKGIELNIEMYGRMGYMIDAGGQAQTGPGNQRKLDYWTPDNTGAAWQKPVWTSTPGSMGDPYAGLLGFKDAAFFKVRNISLGYYLPDNIGKKIGASSMKVYCQMRNLGNIYSSVDYLDLDLGNVSFYNRGITFGLEVSF